MKMNNHSIIARAGASKRATVPVFGAIALILLTAACVSSGKYETALAERDELAELKRAQQEEFNREKEELNREREALETERANLKGDIASLDAEKARLEGQIDQLAAEMKELGLELDREKAEVFKQKQEADRLKSTYDGLVSNLKNELASGQIEIRQLRDGLSVDVAQEILFASGSAKIDKEGQEVLLRVSQQLKETPYEIIVGGHTDNVQIGPGLTDRYPTNWELAAARASSVVRLFEGAGIGVKRLRAVSFGEHHPRDTNETREGRARNRRIEIRLRPVVPDER
jgi:chemotaxis protein MotB